MRFRLPPSRMLFVLAALAVSARAHAQAAPPPDQPDLAIDAVTRARVVDSLAARMTERYVFPAKGDEAAKAVRRRLAAKQYDRITSAKEFADSLTSHLQAVTHDLHVRVHYRHEPIPPMREDEPPPAELARIREQERYRNYGFERVQRLAGNVGYVDLRSFSGDPDAQTTAIAAMNFLGRCDALIVDLRRNGGGSPAMIATLLTYLVEPGDRLNFNNFYRREGDTTVQWWTAPHVPGPRLNGKPVYALTSALTASAAEEFSYDLQTHELGTTVGGLTAGGANPGGMVRLNDHFAAFIATGRAINPVTKTNWEGVGVKPDVDVAPGEALRTAHVAAVTKLLESAKDDEARGRLQRALDAAKQTAVDPAEDFVRSRPRR